MKRLVLFVAILGLPLIAAAQTPLPPVPPAPPAPEAPPVPPLPPSRAPRAVMAPVYMDELAIQEAVLAAREAVQRIDVEAIKEQARAAAEQAREAVRIDTEAIKEQARAAAEQAKEAVAATRMMVPDFKHFEDMKFHLEEAKWAIKDHPFAFAFGQESDGSYSSGISYLNQRQYEQAISRFDRVIAQKGARADAAHYYKAWAQFRLGRTDDAVATIGQLRREYPQSRYLNDAKTLEADARRLKPDQITDDDEIKLLAINSIQYSDPNTAIPLLEDVLNRNNSLALKKRALYVLAQINQPRAHQTLLNYAKGAGNPDLQMEAIKYLAVNRNKQTTSADLQQIYQTTQDTNVKLAIISAFRSSGNTPALVSIAQSSGTPVAIRQSAISGIAGIGGPQDLWALYQKEENKDLRLQMVSAFGQMQALEQLNQILKMEKDPEVRRRAVRSLGSLRSDQTGKMLVEMYGSEQDPETRKAVVSALSSQNNAEALVAIARKESNPALKTDIVRKLTELASRSKVAQDYLMELIKG